MKEYSIGHLIKNNTSPLDKETVFISFAKQDYDLAMQKAHYLISLFNCVVLFLSEDGRLKADEEQFENLLTNIKIFVPIITKNYLSEDCFDLKNVFPLAKSKKVPMMPLILEKGLSKEFNKICGHIQFLEDVEGENANIEEKIIKFHKDLVPDKEFKKWIRSHFINKVFISYRRIDKDLINRVLDPIRNDDDLYDVSIWFDEFLTPGGKYDPEIDKHIKECNIFVLLVTNSLFEKGNYILENEYPLAKQMNKVIIPVYLDNYDESLYNQYFFDLNKQPIEVSLLTTEIKKHLKPVVRDEAHDAAIGYSYLHGINVFKNPLKAKEILSKHEDYLDCIDALVFYYDKYEPDQLEKVVELSRKLNQYDLEHHPETITLCTLDHIKRLSILVKTKKKGQEELTTLVNYCEEFMNSHELEQNREAELIFLIEIAKEALGTTDAKNTTFTRVQKQNNKYNLVFGYSAEIKQSIYCNEFDQAKNTIIRFKTYIDSLQDNDAYEVISMFDFMYFAEIVYHSLELEVYEILDWSKYLSLMYKYITDKAIQFPMILAIMNECIDLINILKEDRKTWPNNIIHRVSELNEKVDNINDPKNKEYRVQMYYVYFIVITLSQYIMLDIKDKVEWLEEVYDAIKRKDLQEMIIETLQWAINYCGVNYQDPLSFSIINFINSKI